MRARRWTQALSPRAFSAWLAAAALLVSPSMSRAADFTAREVTEAFFKAKPGAPLDFSGRDLSFLDLANIDFKGASLANANLYGVDLTRSSLRGTNLSGVKLDRAVMIGADFSGANLEGASVMRPSVYTTLYANKDEAPKFAGANMRGLRMTAMMDGADFRGADLSGARLGPHEPRADISSMPASSLRGCDFSGAVLKGADLMWAKLSFSRFVGADLREVNFSGADLSKADLSGADLAGADLTGADFDGANLSGIKGWLQAKGLATLKNLDRAIR